MVDEWTKGRAWWTRVLHRNALNTLVDENERDEDTRRGAAEETLNFIFVRPSWSGVSNVGHGEKS